MRQLITILMILVGSLVLTTAAKADDVDDVKAAVLAVDAAYNSGDVDAIAQYMHSEHSQFPPGTGLLVEGFDKERLKADFDAGFSLDITARHLGVKIYGNTAVVTGYIEGRVTMPGGAINQPRSRFTEVWIKQGGKWKRVHIHSSPLTGQQ
jgi:ketosteroid isomerase-like protein